jgi:RNA polymerase sigma factor (sigma-70 family)
MARFRLSADSPYAMTQYLAEIHYLRPDPLPAAEYTAVILKAQAGDASAWDFVVHFNLPLVVHVAREWAHRGVEFPDLVQEGNIGLLSAISSWRPDGASFTNHIAYHIRIALINALRNATVGRACRVPAWAQDAMRTWNRAEAALRNRLGRPPTPAEIFDETGLQPKHSVNVACCRQALNVASWEILAAYADSDRYEVPGREATPIEILLRREDRARVRQALAGLHEDHTLEAEVVILSFAIAGIGTGVIPAAKSTNRTAINRRHLRAERRGLVALRYALAD